MLPCEQAAQRGCRVGRAIADGFGLPTGHGGRGRAAIEAGLRRAAPARIQSMAQARHNEAANERRIAKAHLGFGRVNVHVNILGRQFQKQRQYRVPVAGEHFGIGPAHRADQQFVAHRAAVDEKILVIGDAPVEGGQASHTGQPHGAAFKIHNHAIVGQFARDDAGHALGGGFVRLHRQHAAPVMFQCEPDLWPGHGEAADDVEAGGIFGTGAAQEFAPDGHVGEQSLDLDAGAWRQGGRPLARQNAMIDHAAPAFAATSLAAFDGQA